MLGKIRFLLICLVLFASNQVLASGYQYEAGVRYFTKDDNLFNPAETLVAFRMYLQPVSDDSKPYNELAFLARKTSIAISLGQLEYEIDPGPSSVDIDSTLIGVSVEYAKTGSPFVFGLGLEMAEGDEKFFNQDAEADTSSISVSAGYYMDLFTRIGFLVSETEVEIRTTAVTRELDTTSYYVEYLSLKQLVSMEYYSIEARFGRSRRGGIDLGIIQVGGNYYSSLSTSIGGALGFVGSDEDSVEGQTVLLRARHFVDPYTSIAFSFDKFFSDLDSSLDTSTSRLDFLHRF